MSDPTAPVEGASTESAPESATTSDPYAPVLDRMSELASSIDTRFSGIEGRLPQPQQEPEPDPWAALFGEPEQPEYDQPQQPVLDPAALRQAYQADLQQATAPLQQQLQQMQAERAREQLYERVPALRDKAVADQHINSMVQSMQARNTPPEVIQWALSDPDQIALHFEAAEAKRLAAGQAPANEQVAHVESAGGALPGGNGEPVNPVHAAYGGGQPGLAKGFN